MAATAMSHLSGSALGGRPGWATSTRPTGGGRPRSPTSTPPIPPGYRLFGVNDGIVPVENVLAFHRHARSMGRDGDFRLTVDIVDRLADGRPMVPSAIGQADPRNHHPVGGMNAAWFDFWLDDR